MRRAPPGLNGVASAAITSPSGSAGAVRVLAERHAVDCRGVAVEVGEQLLDHGGAAAGVVEIGGDVLAAGSEVRDDGRRGGESVEVVQRQLDPGFVRDCEQVEHAVRRAAGARDSDDGVLERFAGDERRGPHVAGDHVENQRPGCFGRVTFGGSAAGTLPSPIGPSPRKSIATAMVFAVKCPVQAP